jgi:hypothetical protein
MTTLSCFNCFKKPFDNLAQFLKSQLTTLSEFFGGNSFQSCLHCQRLCWRQRQSLFTCLGHLGQGETDRIVSISCRVTQGGQGKYSHMSP